MAPAGLPGQRAVALPGDPASGLFDTMAVALPGGTSVGLETPIVLVAFPILAVVLVALVAYRAGGTAGRRSRRWFLASRLLLVGLLVLAAAGPYTVTTNETAGDPSVTLLVDRSASANVTEAVADEVASGIEETGVPVRTATVATGTESRIGDGIAANAREDGAVVLVSDGQVTGGRSLGEAAELAREVNATVSTVSAPATQTERYVTVNGPATASVGVESRFLVRVGGVETDEPVDVSIDVDGTEIRSETLGDGEGTVEFTHTFDEPGSHRVTAELDGEDRYAINDRYRKTVRVVDQPSVLYVSRGSYPFRSYLADLYDVETADSVPEDLGDYYAVVIQDVAAPDLGNVDALQEFVIDGNGLFVVGGDNAYDRGGYEDAPIASMLPVTFGESGVGSTTVVLAVDVSGSAEEGMAVQKSIALDALSQLGDQNAVGIVGFNWRAYSVAAPRQLAGNRTDLQDQLRRLTSGGATDVATGLRGAAEMLGDRQGTIIFVSDGHDESPESLAIAERLGREGTRVVTVGSGPNPNEGLLRPIATRSGGAYFRADETDRLELLFGGASRDFSGEGLTIVDDDAFVTAGVELTASPGRANDVAVRPGAEFLVATEDGTPALSTWRYGLGRVVSLTAYDGDGSLGDLLTSPDSLLLSKSVNYAVGDPERKERGVTTVPDTRLGESTTVTFRGDARPSVDGVDFRAAEEGVYRADVTPTDVGYHEVLDAAYAANYPAEYGAFGPAAELEAAVEATGGREFAADDPAAIAEFARQESVRVRDVRHEWNWLAVVLALFLFLSEVVVRRLQVYTGRTSQESGLP